MHELINATIDSPHYDYDYPFGRRIRCIRRSYIETTKHGQRFVTQTSSMSFNRTYVPASDGQSPTDMPNDDQWNKPKKSTYSPVRVLMIDTESGHIKSPGLYYGSRPTDVQNLWDIIKDSDCLTFDMHERMYALEAMLRIDYQSAWDGADPIVPAPVKSEIV